DPQGVKELLELIRRLSREMGITVLLSSHHLHQVQEICDRVGLFVQGRLIAVGDVESLSKSLFKDEPLTIDMSVDPVSQELVDALRSLDGVVSIEASGGRLHIVSSSDCSSELARIVIERGASLHMLNKKDYGLDDIYERYFAGGEANVQLAAKG